MPFGMNNSEGRVVGGKLYVVDGNANGVCNACTLAYDPTSNTWTPNTPNPTARFGPQGDVIDGSLYVVGGTGLGNNAVLSTNEAFTPEATVGKVTGGGTIDVSGGIANFGFVVQARSSSGPIRGDLQYVNHASRAKVHSVTFTTFTISGNTATFSGTCTNNGAPCTFYVTVQDNDQPSGSDSFVISIDGGSPEGGTLRSGHIEIHKQ